VAKVVLSVLPTRSPEVRIDSCSLSSQGDDDLASFDGDGPRREMSAALGERLTRGAEAGHGGVSVEHGRSRWSRDDRPEERVTLWVGWEKIEAGSGRSGPLNTAAF
jgi:hypothetical protein